MAHLLRRDAWGGASRQPLADTCVIGRQPECDLVLESPRVSRKHARVVREGPVWWVEDLGSSRGTRVNGESVTRQQLAGGDRIDLAGEVLSFVEDGGAEEDEVDTLVVAERTREELDLVRQVTVVARLSSVTPEAEEPLVALVRAGEKLRQCATVAEVAEAALASAMEHTGAERGALSRVDGQGHEVARHTRSVRGEEGWEPSRTFMERLRSRGTAVIARDVGADLALAQAHSVAARSLRSLLGVPLWSGEAVVGHLYLDTSSRSFAPRHLEIAAVLGLQAAGEIARIELLESTRRHEERRRQLERFLAPEIVERLESGDASTLEARERVVSVVHVEVEGLSDLARRCEVRELEALLGEHLERLTCIAVDQCGGTLDQYLGAGMRALFGAPVGQGVDEDAAAAVRAALAMRDAVEALRRDDGRYALLRLRIGVITGEVVVGMLGTARRQEYSAVGGAVRGAAMLVGQSEPGRVLVTGSTHVRIAERFECVPAFGLQSPDGGGACWWVVRENL